MVDKTIGVNNQTVGTAAPVDVSELTRADGTVAERQRVVIGDPNNAGSMLDLDLTFRAARQMSELKLLEAYEASLNAGVRRHAERGVLMDRRGSIGRGSYR